MVVVAVGFAADGLGRSRESGCSVVMFILVLGGFFGCVCCCRCSSASGSGGAGCGTGAVVVIAVSFATDRFRGRRERRGCSLLVLSRSRSRGSRRGYTGCSWSITVPGERPLARGLKRDDELFLPVVAMGLAADGCCRAWTRIFCAMGQDESSESGRKDESDSVELHIELVIPKEGMEGQFFRLV